MNANLRMYTLREEVDTDIVSAPEKKHRKELAGFKTTGESPATPTVSPSLRGFLMNLVIEQSVYDLFGKRRCLPNETPAETRAITRARLIKKTGIDPFASVPVDPSLRGFLRSKKPVYDLFGKYCGPDGTALHKLAPKVEPEKPDSEVIKKVLLTALDCPCSL